MDTTPTAPVPVSASRFGRYAAAAGAAFGAAAAANAQFVGSYALTPQNENTYGAWTASITNVGNGSTAVNIGSAPTQLTLSVNNSTGVAGTERIDFLTTAQAAGLVQFDLHTSATNAGAVALYYTADGSTFNLINASSYAGTASLLSFSVLNSSTFGFRLTANYSTAASLSAVITGFSAPTAIPEPGASGLLVSCAAGGFVALMGLRNARRRATAAA